MSRKKIGIIGGGAAGTMVAWLLRQKHDVTLYEANDYLGGHAYTHKIELEKKQIGIDMGVDYFNERLSPNLCALLNNFGFETFVAPLSMRFCFPTDGTSWRNTSIHGEITDKLRNEFDRFHKDMSMVALSENERYSSMSIEQFLDENGYSDAFKYQGLLPLMTIYSGCHAPSLEYNLRYAAISFQLNLLSFFNPGYWRKVDGGIGVYLLHMAEQLGANVVYRANIASVSSCNDRVSVMHVGGQVDTLDAVVFATHADITLSLLKNADPVQREILGGFEYVPVESALHHDSNILVEKNSSEYCEFSRDEPYDISKPGAQFGSLTRISNNLSAYKEIKTPILVTFDAKKKIAKDSISNIKYWKLPKLRPLDFMRKRRFQEIQGKNNIWFCGTDTTLTGQEGAIVSGMVIANALGCDYPFSHDVHAAKQYHAIQEFMGFTNMGEQNNVN